MWDRIICCFYVPYVVVTVDECENIVIAIIAVSHYLNDQTLRSERHRAEGWLLAQLSWWETLTQNASSRCN